MNTKIKLEKIEKMIFVKKFKSYGIPIVEVSEKEREEWESKGLPVPILGGLSVI